MAAAQSDAVRQIAADAAGAAGLVLEDVTISQAGRRRVVRVVVDLPEDRTGGVPMEAVAQASQALSAALDDRDDVLGGAPYVLEVSSPGAERPLTERRHWSRARGRLVAVHLSDGRSVEGRLTAADDAGPVLDGGEPLPWATVTGGRVRLDFSGGPSPDGSDDESDGNV